MSIVVELDMTQREDGGLLSHRSRRCFKAYTTSMAVTVFLRVCSVYSCRSWRRPGPSRKPAAHAGDAPTATARAAEKQSAAPNCLAAGRSLVDRGRSAESRLAADSARTRSPHAVGRTLLQERNNSADAASGAPLPSSIAAHGGAVQRSTAAWVRAKGKRGAEDGESMGQWRAARCEQGDAKVWQQAARTAAVVTM